MIGYLFVAAFVLLALAAHSAPPPRRAVMVRLPRTWQGFLRSPLPMWAEDVRLRDDQGGETVATVYNHAAALNRMGHGNRRR